MNNNEKNIELKIYELLGIKIFRKLAFKTRDILLTLILSSLKKQKQNKNIFFIINLLTI